MTTFTENLAHALKVAPLAQSPAVSIADRELYRLTMFHCLNRAFEAVSNMPVRTAMRSRGIRLLDAVCAVCRSDLRGSK